MKTAAVRLVMANLLFSGLVVSGANFDKALVGYWKFDEGQGSVATDSSGKGNHGNIKGNPQWVKETGQGLIRGALEFNGLDNYVDCGSTDSLNLHGKNFTLMAWIYIEEPGGAAILSKELGGRNWPEYGISLLGDLTVQSSFWNANTPLGCSSVSSPVLAVRRWYHLAATSDGSTYTLYIDGVENNRAKDLFGSPYAGGSRLFIGASPHTSPAGFHGPFKGRIAEVAIFSRCLSEEEVEICFQEGIWSLSAARPKPKRSEIIVINGIDYKAYMVQEALAGYADGKVSYHNIVLDTGITAKVVVYPVTDITAGALRKARVLILTDAPAPSLAPSMQAWLKKSVEDGLKVLILGGLFSFGKGQYEGTGLDEIAPVVVNNQWDVKKLDRPLPLEPVQGITFSKEIDWGERPSVLYHHDDKLKEGVQVWLKAGDVPILVVREMGKGYTAGFLTAPIGIPPQGVLAYWKWKDWPKLLHEIVQKLMEE